MATFKPVHPLHQLVQVGSYASCPPAMEHAVVASYAVWEPDWQGYTVTLYVTTANVVARVFATVCCSSGMWH